MSWKLPFKLAPNPLVWRTLAFRLTAGYALAGLLLVFLATASLYAVFVAQTDTNINLFFADKLHVLGTMLRERPDDWDALHEEIELESAARRYQHFYIRLLDSKGQLLLMTPGMEKELDLAQLENETRNSGGQTIAMKGKSGQPFRVASARLPVGSSDDRKDTIEIAIDVSQQEGELSRYRMWFWIILLSTGVIFPLVGYQIARQGIRPVEEMAATTRRITSSNLQERIHPEGFPFELASLAETFNQMLDRLEGSFKQISQFSTDIAHDLRTPVNNIRGEAEVVLTRARNIEEYRDALESVLEESVRLTDLIGNLLFLARAENPIAELQRETVDVAELLTDVRDYYEASASDSGIALVHAQSDGPLLAALDRSLMLRAISNLVSNAVAHTPPGGSVTLAARAEAASIHIDVSDTGIGIPAEALPRVFDRFFRVDASRSQASGGTGLGLSIVQSIAALHGGSVGITSRPEQGTKVTLRMPTGTTR